MANKFAYGGKTDEFTTALEAAGRTKMNSSMSSWLHGVHHVWFIMNFTVCP